MDGQRNSKLSLFLMELIVAIFFFSLAAAVCIRLFTSAHLLAEKTENLSSAVMWSQNLSEAFNGKAGNIHDIADLYPGAYISEKDGSDGDGILILFFDEDWTQVDSSTSLTDASYEGILDVKTMSASMAYADVTDYGTELLGDARVGKIAILDLRGQEDIFSEIPASDEKLILSNSVDIYLGKEGR